MTTMTDHCHHTVIDEDGIEDACGAEVVTTRYDVTWGHDYPVCRLHCPHLATVTDRMHAVIGPWTYTSEPMQVCVTCRTVIDRGGDLTIPAHFKTHDFAVTLPEPEETE